MTTLQGIMYVVIFVGVCAAPVVIAVCILKGLEMYRRKEPNAVIFRVAQKTKDAVDENLGPIFVTGVKWIGISFGVLLLAGLVIWTGVRILSSAPLYMIIIIVLLVGILVNTMKR
jgi:hypothetical protein